MTGLRLAAGLVSLAGLLSCAGARPEDRLSPEEWIAQSERKLTQAASVRLDVRLQRRRSGSSAWTFETRGPDRLHFVCAPEIEGWDEGKQIYVRRGRSATFGRDWPEHEAHCLLRSIARSGVFGWQLSHALDPALEALPRNPIFPVTGNLQTVNGRKTVVIDHAIELGRGSGPADDAGTSRVWIDVESGLPFRRQTKEPSGEEWTEHYQWRLNEPMEDDLFHAPGAPPPASKGHDAPR